MRAAATTAVVAGTAGAVRHHQDQKYAAQDQAAYDQQVAAQQAYPAPPPAAPAAPDYAAELEKLAQLKNQGIITNEGSARERPSSPAASNLALGLSVVLLKVSIAH